MSTERFYWENITAADATDDEIDLVHVIFGDRPEFVSKEQWRENLSSMAKHIRFHVKKTTGDCGPG